MHGAGKRMIARVSVIIPVFNGAAFLRDAVESAIAQTHHPAEIIVVDDGSTDDTAAVAGTLPVILLRQPNLGVSTARNIAIERSTGDYLALLDADDVWLPHKLETQLAAMNASPEAGYAASYIRYFFEPGPETPAWFRRNSPPEQDASYPPSTWLIRRNTWDKVGPFDPGRLVVEDIDWLARAQDMGVTSIMLKEPLVLKRLHQNNLTGRVPEIKQGMLEVLQASAARKRLLRQAGD